jgi:ATP-dependent RNA helicase DeaD
VDAAPVIARGHNLAVLVPPVTAAALPCLRAIPEHRPTLVITPDGDRAVALSLEAPRASIAVSGLSRAQRRLAAGVPAFLFVSAVDALALAKRSALRTADFQTVVLAWPEQLDDDGREALETVMAETARDSQRMILSAAPGPDVEAWIDRYAFKAVTFGFPGTESPQPPPAPVGAALYVVAHRTQVEAARRRILDALDPERDDQVVVSSCPPGRDAAAAVHAQASEQPGGRVVLVVEPWQLPWLRTVFAPLTALRLPTALDALDQRAAAVRARLARTLESENLDRELFLIGPLLERFDPAEVAAAALRLAGGAALAQVALPGADLAAVTDPRGAPDAGARIQSWAKVWIGVGRKDGVRPGDILGAIVGEAKLSADRVGKIDLRELYTLVETHPDEAERVARSLTGTTLRGRRLTARLDRGRAAGAQRRGRADGSPAAPDRP